MNKKIYNHIPTKEELICDFLCSCENENNPTSPNYKRVLTYPKINWIRVFLNILFYSIGVFVIVYIENKFFSIKSFYRISIPVVLSMIYFSIRLSSIIIFIVECYQLLAPAKLRMRCRFEPSCSDYMILSIKKYGAIKGLIKGFKRITRCKYPNGGYDRP